MENNIKRLYSKGMILTENWFLLPIWDLNLKRYQMI